jgi:SAM-dependent methyltransferase
MDYRNEIKLIHLPKYRKALMSRAKMRVLLALPLSIKRALFYGQHYCPVCESHIQGFEDFGYDKNTWCPVCASMQRHRLIWLFFLQKTNLFDSNLKRMLHVAPEVALKPRLACIPNLDYLTADLQDPKCMVKMDITNIQYPDNTFDVIYCSHVLGHVSDDRKAMREFARVSKPEGWAVFMVPLSEEQTVEDPSITNPAERERLFGQYDHVRRYGPDFKDRLEKEGFKVTVITPSQIASMEDTMRMGLPIRDSIFFCMK